MTTNPLAEDLNHVLDHTRDLWDELRGERIFVTGGTGFFGCWLLESFLWANDRLNLNASITVLTRFPKLFHEKAPHLAGHSAVTLIEGDVRTFDFPRGTFSHVIHAAADSNANLIAEKPFIILDTIIDGTRRALDFSVTCGAKKFLLTSSGAVYGKQPAEITRISEDYFGAPDPLNPLSTYGEGKRIAEHLCVLYKHQSNIEVKIARCFAFLGPYFPLDAHFAIGNFIRNGLENNSIFVHGDGAPQRSFLYAADLVIWLWTILIRGTSGEAYNLGSETAISIIGVANKVADMMGCQIEILGKRRQTYIASSNQYVPSTQKARTGLNLKQWIELDLALQKTISWHSALAK